MNRYGVSYLPFVLGFVAVMALLFLLAGDSVRVWGIVLGLTAIAAVGYAAYQEQRASRVASTMRHPVGDPYDALRDEMDRARRHERPLALASVIVPPADGGAPSALLDVLRSGSDQPMWRSSDRSWQDGSTVYVMLPETSTAAAVAMLERTLAAHPEIAPESWHVASFPDDGLTIGALMAAHHAPAPRADRLEPGEALVEAERLIAPTPRQVDRP